MLQPIIAMAVAGLVSVDAHTQDSSPNPEPLRKEAERAGLVPGTLGAGRAAVGVRPLARDPALVDAGLTPGILGGDGNVDTAGILYDNGNTDGSNGYSNGTNVLGNRRTLLDDFKLGGALTVNGVQWTHIWDQGHAPPFGTGAEFQYRSDSGGTPGAVTAVANVTSYDEIPTGLVFFSRPEARSCAGHDPITFAAGTFWLEGTVVGADNDFWLVKSTVTGSECWTDYDGQGLKSGSSFFGVAADLNFKLVDACPGPGCGDCSGALYDNGPTSGTNGYSNATFSVFNDRRTLLDDFVLPSDHDLETMRWTHTWNTSTPGLGTGAELQFRADGGGVPGPVLAVANVTAYCEAETGNVFFSRPEAESIATFDPIAIPGGIPHWVEGTIVGPENNFWLTRSSVTGSECWVDYQSLGGLQPGSAVFGVAADLNFCLSGAPPFTFFCDPSTGSPNNTATIQPSGHWLGSGITIDLVGGPAGQFCYLLIGDGNALLGQPPGSKGDLCLVGGSCLGRYAQDIGQISAGGTFTTDIQSSQSGGPSYGIPSCGGQINAGQTWNFQYWHRQPMGLPSTFSQAVGVYFKP